MILILQQNLNPEQIIQVCKKINIKFYETGLKHGTITALINDYKFEITSLRKDLKLTEDMQMLYSLMIGKKMHQEEIFRSIQFIQI